MQPIEIAERVKTTYKNYIKTAFPVIDINLKSQMYTLMEQKNLLWQGPYLSLQRPYEKSEEAISAYKEIIETTEDNSLIMEVGRLISLCYIRQQEWTEAINSLYNLAVKYPDNPEAQMFLLNIAGIYQKELNEPEQAMKIYDVLISKYPTSHLVDLAKMRLKSLQEGTSTNLDIDK